MMRSTEVNEAGEKGRNQKLGEIQLETGSGQGKGSG